MKRTCAAAALLLLLFSPLCAHRLDEYLQATLISINRDRAAFSMRLIPGVAVSSTVLAAIDANRDGVLEQAELYGYAQEVLRDLAIRVDGHLQTPRLLSATAPSLAQMKDGAGEIQIEFLVVLPDANGKHALVLQNRHQSGIAVYLVNALVPQDPAIHITAQQRNPNQSVYELSFSQGLEGSTPPSTSSLWGGFATLFRLGIRHIAEGTDHLLFLLVLLLPAPLLAVQSRWTGVAGIRRSLLQTVRVVTAFTIGHSLTLALAAWGIVRLPARPVEILIAVSILVSAVHALRPAFPGREAVIAAFFGLIHGLAFAATLGGLGLDRWQRVTGILGFNLGIESMQLIVVAATMPSLLLLSRTPAYSTLRIAGALFALCAAAGWTAERALNVHLPVDAVVNQAAHHAIWIANGLFLGSLVGWRCSSKSGARVFLNSLPSPARLLNGRRSALRSRQT